MRIGSAGLGDRGGIVLDDDTSRPATVLDRFFQLGLLGRKVDTRHEEGGWVYCDPATRTIEIRRAPGGDQAFLDLDDPPELPGYAATRCSRRTGRTR